jgi:beta-glucanase (GH16 family)
MSMENLPLYFIAFIAFSFVFAAIFASIRKTPKWVLTWSDDFDGAAGTAVDASKWTHEIGGGGFGNQELETYTPRPENVSLDGRGNLRISALKETLTGPDGITREYTSGRINTKGKFSQRYGRFEARMKLPAGQGIWPAFWMMGENIDTVGWPDCGEIDIMENIGKEPGIAYGSLHAPDYHGGDSFTAGYLLPERARYADAFHVFAVEWEPDCMRFYVDDVLYYTKTAASMSPKRWNFDRPFFILLNVAVGGSWPGSPDATSTYPQEMLVDYVRVYQRR